MAFPSVWMPFKLHYLVVWFGFYFLLISYSFQNWHKVFYLFFKYFYLKSSGTHKQEPSISIVVGRFGVIRTEVREGISKILIGFTWGSMSMVESSELQWTKYRESYTTNRILSIEL